MTALAAGAVIDGFQLGELMHKGGMALNHGVACADGRTAPFPMVMKVPRMTAGDGAETIVSFEVEHQMMQALTGPHVPRLVAAGDLSVLPYLVMEYVPGRTLDHWLDQVNQGVLLAPETLAQLGAAVAHAAHSLHEQNAVHLDLKPANVVIRDDGSAVLLDFGLSFHAHYPDLLAEETRHAVGSPAYMSPEQVVGVRGDPRSDVFAIGVCCTSWPRASCPLARRPAWAACASACGWTRSRRARAGPTCPSGCRKSSCAAWSRPPPTATLRPRTWPLI